MLAHTTTKGHESKSDRLMFDCWTGQDLTFIWNFYLAKTSSEQVNFAQYNLAFGSLTTKEYGTTTYTE